MTNYPPGVSEKDFWDDDEQKTNRDDEEDYMYETLRDEGRLWPNKF